MYITGTIASPRSMEKTVVDDIVVAIIASHIILMWQFIFQWRAAHIRLVYPEKLCLNKALPVAPQISGPLSGFLCTHITYDSIFFSSFFSLYFVSLRLHQLFPMRTLFFPFIVYVRWMRFIVNVFGSDGIFIFWPLSYWQLRSLVLISFLLSTSNKRCVLEFIYVRRTPIKPNYFSFFPVCVAGFSVILSLSRRLIFCVRVFSVYICCIFFSVFFVVSFLGFGALGQRKYVPNQILLL